jgi:hypothetical protein
MKSLFILSAMILMTQLSWAQASEKDCSDSEGIKIVREVR